MVDKVLMDFKEVEELNNKMKKLKMEVKRLKVQIEVMENDSLNFKFEKGKMQKTIERLGKEKEELEAKLDRFTLNQQKGKAGNLVKRKRIARGIYREIIRQNCETKSIREIHKMCVREGFTGTYHTMRLSVLDFEIEQFLKKGMTSLQIQEALKIRRPKTKIEIKTIEELMENLRERKGKSNEFSNNGDAVR